VTSLPRDVIITVATPSDTSPAAVSATASRSSHLSDVGGSGAELYGQSVEQVTRGKCNWAKVAQMEIVGEAGVDSGHVPQQPHRDQHLGPFIRVTDRQTDLPDTPRYGIIGLIV